MDVKSLKDTARIAAAISILYRERPKDKLRELLKDTIQNKYQAKMAVKVEKLRDIAENEINMLVLPVTLKDELKCTIIPICWEILSWTKHFSKPSVWAGCLCAVEDLHWTSEGRVDGALTAKRWLNKESVIREVNTIAKFKVAVSYSLSQEVKDLILKEKQFLSPILNNLTRFKGHFNTSEYLMINLWTNAFIFHRPINGKKITAISFVEVGKKYGNYNAVNFFYSMCNFPSREYEVEYIGESLKDLCLKCEKQYFPLSYQTSILVFFLEKLQIEELEKILMKFDHVIKPQFILKDLLLYPFRHIFFKYAEILINFIDEDSAFVSLLIKIAVNMLQDPQFYKTAFSFVWENIKNQESALKLILQKQDLILQLLIAGSYENVKLIMNSVSAADREKFIADHIKQYSGGLFNAITNSNSVVNILRRHKNLDIYRKFLNSDYANKMIMEEQENKAKELVNNNKGTNDATYKVIAEALGIEIPPELKFLSDFLVDFLLEKGTNKAVNQDNNEMVKKNLVAGS